MVNHLPNPWSTRFSDNTVLKAVTQHAGANNKTIGVIDDFVKYFCWTWYIQFNCAWKICDQDDVFSSGTSPDFGRKFGAVTLAVKDDLVLG